jgi:hypothetical protein
MSNEMIEKEDLFNVIKHGHRWHAEIINEKLTNIINKKYTNNIDVHSMRWDSDDKYHFIYDNECYLFIFDGKIELRCDRDNVFSSYQTINFPIKSDADIENAYSKFYSMTLEGEEDD